MIYSNSDAIQIVHQGPSVRRKNVLFVRSGKKIPRILENRILGNDVILILSLYDTPEFDVSGDIWVFAGGLSKLHAAKKVFEAYPSLLEANCYWFVDPDINLVGHGVEEVFGFFNSFSEIRAAQCAVDKTSFTCWPMLVRDESDLAPVEVNFVEVMAPIFRNEALRTILVTFDEALSTWGVDFAWTRLLKGRGMYLLPVTMSHPEAPDFKDGAFYRYLQKIGCNHDQDFLNMKTKYSMRFFTPSRVVRYCPPILWGRIHNLIRVARRLSDEIKRYLAR